MTKIKTLLGLVAVFTCGGLLATPGAFSTWFENAVPNYDTDSNWTTSEQASLAGTVLTIDDWSTGVRYTPAATSTDYQKETITITADPIDWADLPATNADVLDGAKFAICVALPEGSDTPVFAALTSTGWVAVDSPSPIEGSNHTLDIVYSKTANTFTITENDVTSDPLTAWGSAGSAIVSTTILGTGSVSVLSGETAIEGNLVIRTATEAGLAPASIVAEAVTFEGYDPALFGTGAATAADVADGTYIAVVDNAVIYNSNTESNGGLVFSNKKLSDISSLTATMSGKAIDNKNGFTQGFIFDRTPESFLVQFQYIDGTTLKCAAYTFYQVGEDIYAKGAFRAHRTNTTTIPGTKVTDNQSSAADAIAKDVNSYHYGVYNLKAIFGGYTLPEAAYMTTVSGTVTVNDSDLFINVPDGETRTITNTFAGDGRIVKTGAGTLDLTGTVPATMTVVVKGGTVKLPNTTAATVQIDVGGTYDVNSTGSAYANVKIIFNGGTMTNGGTADCGYSQIQFTDVSVFADSFINTPRAIFFIKSAYGVNDIKLNGHKLTKTGSGECIFRTPNFVGGGAFEVQDGHLKFYDPKLAADAALAATIVSGKNMTIGWSNGTPSAQQRAQLNGSFTLDNAGTFTAETPVTIDVPTDTTMSGLLAGAGAITKKGEGKWTLSHSNSFSGGLDVTEGTVFAGNVNALGTGTITVRSGASVVTQQYSNNSGYSIVLDGGTLKSPGAGDAHGKLVKSLRLTANSTFEYTTDGTGSGLIGVGHAGAESTLDLNGFQLDLVGKDNNTRVYLDKITTMTAGTLRVVKGKLFLHCNTLTAPEGSKLIVEENATVELAAEVTNRELSFPEIVYNGTVQPVNTDVPTLKATAKFSGTGSLPKLTIGDGATIDCANGSAKVSNTLTFEGAVTLANAIAGDTILTVTGTHPAVPTVTGGALTLAFDGNALKVAVPEITPSAGGLVINVADAAIYKDGVVIPDADGTIPNETGVYTVKKGDVVVAEVAVIAQTPTAKTTTLVAVPFEGLDGAAVTAASLLNTKLLVEGDQLKVYDGAKYRLWTLTADKTWDAGKTVTAAGVVEADSAADITLARGKAVWVTTAAKIMTYGRKNADGVKPAVSSGVNLLGNTKIVATDLSDIAEPGDEVEIPGDTSGVRTFTKTSTGWSGVKTVTKNVTLGGVSVPVKSNVETTQAPSVPAGRGYFLRRQ